MEEDFDLEFEGIELRIRKHESIDVEDGLLDGQRLRYTAAVEDRKGNIYRATWYAHDDVPRAGAESEEWDKYLQAHGGDDRNAFHDEYDYFDIAELELVSEAEEEE